MIAAGDEQGPSGRISKEEMRRVGLAFVAGINSRDPAALARIFSPDAVFRPRVLSMSKASYRGHEGLEDFFTDLRARDRGQQVRTREIRLISPAEFVILANVVVGGEHVSPAAIIIQLDRGQIVKANGFLSDEDTMISVGLLPGPE